MDGNQQVKKKFDPTTAKRFDPTSATLSEPSTEAPREEGSFLSQMVGNIPSSAAEFGKNLISPITNPVETIKGIGKLAASGGNPTDPAVQQLGKYFVDRYGGWDNVANTIKTDPVGFLSDLSTAFTGAGAVTKTGKIAQIAKTAGKITDPVSIASNTARQVARVIPESAPLRLYESAIKPATSLSGMERTNLARTGLKEGAALTQKGLNKVQSKIDAINNVIQVKIVNAAKKGEMINANEVVKRLDDVKELFGNTVTPSKYLKEIDELQQDFLGSHGTSIPIDKAQKIKQNTYAVLRKAYGELSTSAKETQKGLARGIKEEIAKKHPELSSLNKEDGALIELEEAIQNAVNKQYNKEIIPGSSIWTAAAGTMAGGPGVGASAFLGRLALENPVVKSKLAIALNRARSGKPVGGKLPPYVTGIRVTKEQE